MYIKQLTLLMASSWMMLSNTKVSDDLQTKSANESVISAVTENRQYLPPSLSEVHPHQDFSSLFQWMKKWYLLQTLTRNKMSGQAFTIEAKITFPIDLKKLYMLVCSNCGQDVRYPTIREIHCMNCDQKNLLVPRCRFDVDLKDNSVSTIGIIMDKEGEKLLSLTAEEIYKRASDPVLLLIKS
uniref:Uncharacterized protein n=1 Tax=Solanum tuberosum TaxID=4113 RepID=M1BIT3_SOLTU